MLRSMSVVGALLCLVAGGAAAQSDTQRLFFGAHLSGADYASANKAMRRLVTGDKAQIGSSETWSNEVSGNSGVLTINASLRRDTFDCRTVQSDLTYQSGRERRVLFDYCAVPNRCWKVVS